MRRLRRALFHGLCRLVGVAHRAAVAAAGTIGRRRRRAQGERPLDVLVTATFHSDNWIAAHIRPLARSSRCRRVRIVATRPVPAIEGVHAIYPHRALQRVIGGVPSRLATFAWEAWRRPPDIVGGFHLLLNGLVALIAARLVGARSLYFCVGGAAEVLDGGIASENRLFTRMETPDASVERGLLKAVRDFDWVIAMGTSAVRFFKERGVDASFEVVSGGIDAGRFRQASCEKEWDLVYVGRLAPIKRPDLFIRTVAEATKALPALRAVVLGEGPLRAECEALARELGVADSVTFAGLRTDVERFVARSRVFVNTSDSEGLPLSVMEAMMCGVPCVVSDVGDLRDLVDEGVNGYAVRQRSPEAFAERVVSLLRDPVRLQSFAEAARRASARYEIETVARKWDEILRGGEESGR